MREFPDFMKNPVNAVSSAQQSKGMDGYIFDGIDGSQMIIWQCQAGGKSKMHTHSFDEYFVVIEGEFTGNIGDEKVKLVAGGEYFIPKGTSHDGEYSPNFRAIYAFSAKRADREYSETIR